MQATHSPPLNTKLIMPFVQSARAVLSSMAGMSVTIGRPYLKTSSGSSYDLSVTIGFSGEVRGSIILRLQRATALRLVQAFTGSVPEASSPDFADALGELANMIAGSAKKDLGAMATISMPTVVFDEPPCDATLDGTPPTIIPCSTAAGELIVEVNLHIARPPGDSFRGPT